MTDSAAHDEPKLFGPLEDYDKPELPTYDWFQTLLTRAREMVRHRPTEPMVTDDRLRRSTLEMLDEVVSPPACGPLLVELQASLADWIADPAPRLASRLIVLPPGDRNDVIAAWAEQNGHTLLEAPARSAIIDKRPADVPDLTGDGVLVIPALERWFVRHRNGLTLIRGLLAALDGLDRHVVVGCNSWAWQYLVRAVRADVIFGAPITFQAFDAHRLRNWLSEISESDAIGRVQFREADSGADIMALDDNGQPHGVLVSLAARSRGIPWVAWRIWRRSLRRRVEVETEQNESDSADPAVLDPSDDEHTLWVIALEEFSLPGGGNDDTLLLLHALLIHGPLALDQLALVLPQVRALEMLPALISIGIVERREDATLACAPAAYPAIRAGLTTAGFPIAAI